MSALLSTHTTPLKAQDLRYQLYLRKNAVAAGDTAWTRFADGSYPDTLSVRAGLPYELVLQIQDGLVAVSKTDQGKDLLKTLYNINGLAPATDSEYDSVRTAAKVLGLDLEQELAPR